MTTLRKLQLIQLEMLDVFAALCEKHNLAYFLDGGTCLGAVRHKGFIPWDDDIDIGMPRKDYEKLIRLCKKDQPSGYFLQEARTYKKYFLVFAKLRKDNTLKIDSDPHPYYPEEHRGINIDIFPYDESSPNEMVKKIQNFLLEKIRFILHFKRGYRTEKISFLHYLIKLALASVLPNKLLHTAARFLMTFKTGKSGLITAWDCTYSYQKQTFPVDVIFPLVKLKFEGKQYYVPGNWDAYLRNLYGDYMQLPPENERKTHGSDIIFNIEKNERGSY
jgi:lipopolysaccharide cholinephosphotransferase